MAESSTFSAWTGYWRGSGSAARTHDVGVSYTAFRRFVRRYVDEGPRRAVVRMEVGPGEEAQVDFGYVGLVPRVPGEEPRKTWTFVMTLSHSQHQYVELVQDQTVATWDAILRKSAQAGLGQRITAAQHDVRRPLPSDDASFDACYSHMLFCMALTTAECAALSREILRVLRPGGLCVYTVRNTSDPDFGRGIHRGETLYENQGFSMHFFDREKVEQLARSWEIVSIDEFEEAKLPRRLFRVTLRKPLHG